MKIKRPSILFITSTILGIIIAIKEVSFVFKLILIVVAIFLYLKLYIEKKLYLKTIIFIFVFCIIGFFRFKIEEKKFDMYVKRVESIGKGKKVLTGKVESIGKSTNSNYYVLSGCNINGLDLGKCRCYFSDELKSDIKIGNSIKVISGITAIDAPLNEGEFNQKNYYRSYGITFIAFANNIEVTNTNYSKIRHTIYEIKIIVKNQIIKIFNEKDAGLFSAMITGDKSTIDKQQKKKFADNGIAHILAISGLHLSILGLALFELLRKRFSVNFSASFVSIFILLYGIFIDAGPSSLRAITMLFVRFLSLAVGRTYDSKNTLFIVAFIFIMMQPYLLLNAGFQFSYVAIYALNSEVKILNIKKISKIVNKNIENNNRYKILGIKISERKIPAVIILTAFLFPITIFHYFTYPLYSIFLNLIVIPLMTFVLGFGLAGLISSFIFLPVGKILAFVVHIIFIVYDKLCELIELLPSHLLVIGKPNLYELIFFYIVLFTIMVLLNKNTKDEYKKFNDERHNIDDEEKEQITNKLKLNQLKKIIICFFALVIATLTLSIRQKSSMRMTFLAIGQGDGIIIESNDLILSIDGGSTSNTSNGQYLLAPHIKSRAIGHINYSFITHADSDHTNGIQYLLENEDEVKIYNLVLPITAIDDYRFNVIKKIAEEKGVNIIYLKEENEMTLKNYFKITTLSPNEMSLQNKKRDENEMSLTFRLDYKNHSALFTGDIGKETMYRILKDDFTLRNIDVDVLKVPHHGSKNSNVKEFFELSSPKYSIFSYGKNNNYGHPNKETLGSVESTGSKIFKTAENGQIDIYFDGETINYNTFMNR